MKKRLYSLFEKVDGKWVRQTTLSFHKDVAGRLFQSRLIDGCLSGKIMELRVVKT